MRTRPASTRLGAFFSLHIRRNQHPDSLVRAQIPDKNDGPVRLGNDPIYDEAVRNEVRDDLELATTRKASIDGHGRAHGHKCVNVPAAYPEVAKFANATPGPMIGPYWEDAQRTQATGDGP